jgi:hypothetical protein
VADVIVERYLQAAPHPREPVPAGYRAEMRPLVWSAAGPGCGLLPQA